MGAEDNIKTIQLIYEAFGRGDVATIVANVTDDVDWGAEAAGTAAPWYGPRRGPSGVQDYFTAFASTMDVEEFVPLTFAGTDDEVLTVVRFAAKNHDTGKSVSQHLHHYFRFRDGKVAYYRGTEDTAQVAAVFEK
jgi:ketosteroid isomerase-like protein